MGKRVKNRNGFGAAVYHKGILKWVRLCAGLGLFGGLVFGGCAPSVTQEVETTPNRAEEISDNLLASQEERRAIVPKLADDPVFKASGFINQGSYEKDSKQIYRVGHDYFIINFDHGGILLMASLREPIIKYVTQSPTPKAPSSWGYEVSNNVTLSLHGSLDDTPNCMSYYAAIGATENTVIEFGVLVFEDNLGQRKILITKYYQGGCPEQQVGEETKFTLNSIPFRYRTMDIIYTSETELTTEITQHPFPPQLNQK